MILSQRLTVIFFLLGVFTCTWDNLLSIDIYSATVKAHQGFFFLSLLLNLYRLRNRPFSDFLYPFKSMFGISVSLLIAFYLIGTVWSEYQIKTFFYSIWLGFSLIAIWLNAVLMQDILSRRSINFTLVSALLFNAIILMIDHLAFYQGYSGGLIGGNQDIILKWGISRPHAFSSEPSYIANFLSLGLIFTHPFPNIASRVLKFLFFLIVLSAIVISTSRTGILAVLLAAVAILGASHIKNKILVLKKTAFFLSCLAFIVLIIAIFTPEKHLRKTYNNLVLSLFTGQDGSASARYNAFSKSFQLARETNWVGTGLGASYVHWMDRQEKRRQEEEQYVKGAPSNFGKELIMSIWGQMFAEGGILGLFLFFLAGLGLVRRTIASYNTEASRQNLSIVVCAIFCFFYSSFFIGNFARGDLWVFLALLSVDSFKKS